jgi:predicted metal-binding protein
MIDTLTQEARKRGAYDVRIINPTIIRPRRWVRIKCQFGCPAYGTNYTCPPHVGTLEEARELFSEYSKGILIEFQDLATLHDQKKVLKALLHLEKQAFFEGYYKAFGVAAGPCHLCTRCKAIESELCIDMRKRPSLEALGVDVYELVNDAGFTLRPIHKKNEPYKSYGLLLLE